MFFVQQSCSGTNREPIPRTKSSGSQLSILFILTIDSLLLNGSMRLLATGEDAPFIEEKFIRMDGSVIDVE